MSNLIQEIKSHIAALENKAIEDLDTWIADLKALVDKAEKASGVTVSGADLATNQLDGPGGSTTGGKTGQGGTHNK